MRKIESALGPTINPGLLGVAERLRYGSYRRREEVNAAVLALAKDPGPIKEIERRLDHRRQVVRQIIQGEWQDISRTRRSLLEPRLLTLPVSAPVVCLRTPPTGQNHCWRH
jgi:hypothetical protein